MQAYHMTQCPVSSLSGSKSARIALSGRYYFVTGREVAETEDRTAPSADVDRTSGAQSLDFTNGECDFIKWQDFKFKRLTQQWHEERGAASSITEIAMCPAYQKIIAMGEAVLPLILRQLESEGDEPDMWFWALRAITNVNPVTEDMRGDMVAMAQAWLAWGRERYAW